ncbi:relaxase/mobilization nuclease domain-containing protein [Salinicola halophilus]|uniref:relaxase/mobilization nuclease domain-containing protein n=1 Tax=Salinicola halophilus TaxID=184065 RepID=UPI000DA1B1E2|nr:relaxase/mobilization nuclease domain-containing protein [Salinicola halophilus]
MIVKLFRHGANQKRPRQAVKNAVGYLFSSHDSNGSQRAVEPSLVRGNVDLWSQVVEEGNFAGRYTSGVLAFAENDIPEDTQQRIISDFEKALLPGLEPDQYASLWVRHEDKGNVELHFMVAGEELSTGKRLNAYYHRVDKHRVDTWKNAVNAEYGFLDPNSPNRQQSLTSAKDLPKVKQEIVEAMNEHLTNMVVDGEIKNRKELLVEITKLKLEVARETKQSISIVPPSGGQNIRLTGAIYARDFDANNFSSERLSNRVESYDSSREERAFKSRESLEAMCRKRSEANRKKYCEAEEGGNSLFSDRLDNASSARRSNQSDSIFLFQRQNYRLDFAGEPKLYSMSKNRGNKQRSESMSTKIKKGKNNEADKYRDNDFFENFRRRIRKTRRVYNDALESVRTRAKRFNERNKRSETRKSRFEAESRKIDSAIARLEKQKSRQKSRSKGFDYPAP